MTINSTYAIDLVGRIYTLEVKNLITGEVMIKLKTRQGIPPGQVIIILFSILPR
jgi:hypothetical protein